MAKVMAAGLFLVNKDNKILIGHPTHHAQNVWSIPKGKIEEGEESFEAALRETYEETNINLIGLDLNYSSLPTQTYTHKKKALVPFVLLEIDNPGLDFNSFDIKCNSNVPEERGNFPEMDDYSWKSIDELIEGGLIHYTQMACLDAIEKLIELTWMKK